MKRANGTGTISKLSGNRRKPYVVRVSAKDKRGRSVQRVLSYHAKPAEAQAALDEYNRQRAAGIAPASDKLQTTVSQVYELWSSRKYAEAGESSVGSYRAAWARLAPVADMKIRDVTIDHLQNIIDNDAKEGRSKSSINNVKTLMTALFSYAMERDIIGKDYSAFVKLPSVQPKHEKGAFTEQQMADLWQMYHAGDPMAGSALVLCYTGFRISEFLALTPLSFDGEAWTLTGGSKTAAGKNRVVPIHSKIRPIVGQMVSASRGGRLTPISDDEYRSRFSGLAERLGLAGATPHWCRHTFASRARVAGMDDLAVRRIMGHADKNVTEHYTHTNTAWLASELEKVN